MGVNSARGVGALNYSLEFKGGTATNVTFAEEYTLEEIDDKIVTVDRGRDRRQKCTGSKSRGKQAGCL